jgi:transposase/regulator of replication initiation timing
VSAAQNKPDTRDKEIAALERLVLALRGEIGGLKRQVESLTEELATTRLELKEERAQHRVTKQRLSELINAIEHTNERHRALVRREFGASSERLIGQQGLLEECLDAMDPELQDTQRELQKARDQAQACLVVSDAQGDSTAAPGVAEKDTGDRTEKTTGSGHKRPPKSGGRKALPEDMPHRQLSYLTPADHPYLQNIKSYTIIGKRVIERLNLESMRVVVEEITCSVAMLEFHNGVRTQQTLAPPSVLGNGQASDSVLINSTCDKILDHLPSYRQSSRFERLGFPIHRAKLCRWHMALANAIEGIADGIFQEIITEAVVGIDDTIHRLLDSELRRCKNGRLWAVTGEKDAFYLFSETREGKWISDLLGDFTGGVMGDAYSGHNVLLERQHVIALYCWAHVRRKFFDATDSLKRQQALQLIGQLYTIERELTDQPPAQKVAARTKRAKPILAQFKQLLDAWNADPTVLPKSCLGRATTYALNQWDGLITYVTIGESPIDNNRTERAVRPNALHRKNSLFSATVGGAKAYATLSTVIHSACNHGLNPERYLTDVLEDLHFRRREPSELTPARYAARIDVPKAVKQPR